MLARLLLYLLAPFSSVLLVLLRLRALADKPTDPPPRARRPLVVNPSNPSSIPLLYSSPPSSPLSSKHPQNSHPPLRCGRYERGCRPAQRHIGLSFLLKIARSSLARYLAAAHGTQRTPAPAPAPPQPQPLPCPRLAWLCLACLPAAAQAQAQPQPTCLIALPACLPDGASAKRRNEHILEGTGQFLTSAALPPASSAAIATARSHRPGPLPPSPSWPVRCFGPASAPLVASAPPLATLPPHFLLGGFPHRCCLTTSMCVFALPRPVHQSHFAVYSSLITTKPRPVIRQVKIIRFSLRPKPSDSPSDGSLRLLICEIISCPS